MLLLFLVAGALAGCEKSSESTMLEANGKNGLIYETAARARRNDHIENLNKRMLVDDWDRLWLYERSSMLNPYVVRVGR